MRNEAWLLSKGKREAIVIFGIFPYTMIFGATYLCYIYLIYKAFFVRPSRFNMLLMLFVAAFCSIYVYAGVDYIASGVSALGAVNVSLAVGFLLISFLFKSKIDIESCFIVDILIFTFYLVCMVNLLFPNIFGFESYALMQIASFNVALYLMVVRGWGRRLSLFLHVVLGGGRSIIAGVVMGVILSKLPKVSMLHKNLARLAFIAVVSLLCSGVIISIFQDYLQTLAWKGVFLKGRTGFWLALLDKELSYLGHGAGASAYAVYEKIGIFHQPHNDLLRVYTDYGLLILCALLFSFFMNCLKGSYALYATLVLVAFMATGNPLSFATAISCYMLSVCALSTKKKQYHVKNDYPLPTPSKGSA